MQFSKFFDLNQFKMFSENITLISAVYFINPKTLKNAAFCKTKNNGTK